MPFPGRLTRVLSSRRARRASLTALSLSLLGCSSDAPSGTSPTEPLQREPAAECRAPTGVSNSPRTIADTVALVNALPKPLTLSCFLSSLARPLQITGTNSIFSAQPAQGRRSPRIFLFQEPLRMSIVPDGVGAPLLEFGEERPDFRSLKAEIPFPVLSELLPSAPFQGFLFQENLSTCGVCHKSESEEPSDAGVKHFVSQTLRPLSRDKVTAGALQRELAGCDFAKEPARCALLDGLLGFGTVADQDFPVDTPTFGG